MSDFFRLKKSDAQLQAAIDKVAFFDINPLNLVFERELVLKNQDYDPFFIYPDNGFDFENVQAELSAVDAPESLLGTIINRKRDLFIDKCEMLKNRGSKKFGVFSRKVYGIPSKRVLEHAASLLPLEPVEEKSDIPSSKAVSMIQAEMNHYGFDYSVVAKRINSGAMVLPVRKKVLVRSDFLFSEKFVKRLVAHEIGTHVLRAENGREQPFSIFFHGFPDFLSTEEGLAVYNEERFGLLNNDNLRDYAARSVAVQMCLSSSFSGIYKYLLGLFPEPTAFRIATRVKRGLADTSKPGGCTKDYVYIDGYLKVRGYMENGGSLSSLYYGKLGIEHLPVLQDIQGLSRPRHLPRNQSFKSLLSF
jgi:uncharacterized protein (TIGR02421 family)